MRRKSVGSLLRGVIPLIDEGCAACNVSMMDGTEYSGRIFLSPLFVIDSN